MNRNGFFALLLGAGMVYAFFHLVLGVEAFTLFYIFFLKVLSFAKGFIARFTVEAAVFFGANFFKRAVVKFFLIQIPMTLGIPLLSVLLFNSQTRRRFRVRLNIFKRRLQRRYRKVRNRFDGWFGVNGLMAFVLSLSFAVATLFYSIYFLGFEFFFWIGAWGPIGTFAKWIWSWIRYFGSFARNIIYRFPAVGSIIAFFATLWKKQIVTRLPHVEWHRKRLVNKSLRTARNSREHSLRVYIRWTRRRERRKKKAKEKRQQSINDLLN